MTPLDAVLAILCLTVMLVGLFGSVVPTFPGIHLVWFGVFLSAVVTQFTVVDATFLSLTGVLVLLSYALDYWNIKWGLKEFRATWHGVTGAVIGSLFAGFFGLFPALTIGPVLGAIVGEMLSGRDSVFAVELNQFRLIGYVGSSLMKVAIGLVIIGAWFVQIIRVA